MSEAAFLVMLTLIPTSPERFSDHVFVGDAVVGQGLAPHGVQRVVQGLGSEFIGLQDKRRTFSRRIGEHGAPLELTPQVRGFGEFPARKHQHLINMFQAASRR